MEHINYRLVYYIMMIFRGRKRVQFREYFHIINVLATIFFFNHTLDCMIENTLFVLHEYHTPILYSAWTLVVKYFIVPSLSSFMKIPCRKHLLRIYQAAKLEGEPVGEAFLLICH